MRRFTIFIIIVASLIACSKDADERLVVTPTFEMEVEVQPEILAESYNQEEEYQGNQQSFGEVQSEIISPELTPTSAESGISVWHGMEGDSLLALREIILNFQRQGNNIQIEMVYSPYDALLDQFVSAIKGRVGPTLILGPGNWGNTLHDLEMYMDLANFIPSNDWSKINPPALEMVSYRDEIVGLPLMISGGVLYRNTSIMPEAPGSFDDLITYAQEVTSGEILGAYLDRGSLNAFPQITACGGSMMFQTGYPAFNNQAGICWIDLLESFDDAGAVTFNSEDDLERFKSGGVGIIIDGTWNIEVLVESLGDKLVVDPWPVYQNRHLSGYVWSEVLYVNPNLSVDDVKELKVFFQYLTTPEAQSVLARYGLIPVITDLETENPIISQAIKTLSLGTPYPVIPEIELYFEPLFDAFQAVFTEGVGASEALQSAADEIIESVDKFNIEEVDL